MPYNETKGTTEGFAFVEFVKTEAANEAIAKTNDWNFDKSHKLTVIRYDAFQKYRDVPDEFVPPVPVEVTGITPDRFYWMMDEHFRDQFCIRWSNSDKTINLERGDRDMSHETEIFWSENRGAPALDYGGEKQKSMGQMWTTGNVYWSPQGTFLTTLHPQGAKLWFGKGFREGLRLLHARVNAVLWSPDESYVATWNGCVNNNRDAAKEALVLWDALTGVRIRSFTQRRIQDAEPDFSWSMDGKHLARIDVNVNTGKEEIRIYKAPAFNVRDMTAVDAPGARDLSWCPKKHNLLAYWIPASDVAGRKTLTTAYIVKAPSGEVLRSRPNQNVESYQLHWHPEGEYLAVLGETSVKGGQRKKTVEIFRLRSGREQPPVEALDIQERVQGFAWEPHGNRFALMIGEGPKFSVHFYSMPAERGVPTLLFTVNDRTINTLHWSPRGEFMVFAGLQINSGYLEFFDVERRKSLGTTSHDVATNLLWDPSGRLVATIKTQPLSGNISTRDTVGNGYTLWTFQGTRVYEAIKPKMFQFIWRPRMENLLTDEETKDVGRNLRRFIGKYLDEDQQRRKRKELLARLRKRKALDDFRAFIAERNAEYEANRDLRIDSGLESEEAPEFISYEDVYEVKMGEEVTLVE